MSSSMSGEAEAERRRDVKPPGHPSAGLLKRSYRGAVGVLHNYTQGVASATSSFSKRWPFAPNPSSTPSVSSALATGAPPASSHHAGPPIETSQSKAISRSSMGIGSRQLGNAEDVDSDDLEDDSEDAAEPGFNLQSPLQSIAKETHREKTALHALRDTFEFDLYKKLMRTLPSIPCMSTAHQSGIYASDDDYERTSSGNASAFDTVWNELTGNVMMLGGYRGSILRDAKTGRRLWVPLKVGINVRKVDLTIGLSDQDELESTKTVIPGKALAAIAGFVDLGKRLKDKLKLLESQGAIKFHSFGYDWRRNLDLSSKELVAKLEAIKAETGQGTIVLAHSMGGLVTLHALATAPDPTIFRGIVFGSTPFAGTPNILQPFRYGDSILFNKEICTPATVFSFRSSFYMLPTDNVCFENTARKQYMVDFVDPQSWFKFGISPVVAAISSASPTTVAPSSTDKNVNQLLARAAEQSSKTIVAIGTMGAHGTSVNPGETSNAASQTRQPSPSADVNVSEVESYLRRTLQRVQRFRSELTTGYNPSRRHLYPPIVMIASNSTPTVRGAIIDTEEELQDGKYDRLLFGEGDGIITHDSATAIPKVWSEHVVCIINSKHGHVSLLSDLRTTAEAITRVLRVDSLRQVN